MQFKFLAPLALAGSALAGYSNVTDTTITEVVTAYTTYCPEPTEIVQNGKTYTVTEATTLTITDCPCTLTYTSEIESTSASEAAPSETSTISTAFEGGAAKAGVAGLAAVAGAAVYLL